MDLRSRPVDNLINGLANRGEMLIVLVRKGEILMVLVNKGKLIIVLVIKSDMKEGDHV